MIVERDYKVKNFIKEKYFIIELDCGDFIAVSEKIEDVANAMQIMNDCKGKNAVVSNLKKEKKTQNPPKLYDLTTLQREANRLFSFSAQETLDAAQKLYEQKLVTYPRTDSQFITDDMADSTANIVANLCSKLNLDKPDIEIKRVVNAAKVSDHHAILPTAHSLNADLSSLSERDKAVLNLVTLKLLCATAQPYIYESVTAEIKCGGHSFTAKGRSDISAGWKHTEARVKSALGIKVITNDEKDEKDDSQAEKSLNVSENQAFDNPVCSLAEKFTSPPKHFTEDTLLSAMETAGNKDYVADSGVEKRGIGTPATRANVIESLIFKGFILRKGKLILGSEKGVNLIKIAPDKLKSAALTAEWETALQNIEKSKASADSFMAEIEDLTRNLVAENAAVRAESASAFSQPLEAKASLGKCPKCGGEVTETPKAYSCGGGRGECKFVLWKSQFYKENALSAAQAKKLLERGKTDLIKGFVSKAKGTKYDAFLVLKSDFSVGMAFS
jgi:DNA topoisomerase-3